MKTDSILSKYLALVILLTLTSMQCSRYRNVSEGSYLNDNYCQYNTDTLPIIIACNRTGGMLHNHSLIRIEQWFNSSQSFTLYADSVYIEYSGEVFRPEMMNIEGATVDSIIIEGMTPIAFALKFKKSCDKLFGDSLILYEKIHNGLSTDTVKAGFFIDRHEWNREQVQSLQKNPKYRAIGEFYAKHQKVESCRFFYWLDYYPSFASKDSASMVQDTTSGLHRTGGKLHF